MNNGATISHNIFLYDRSKMELTGILDVESFTDNNIIALSSMGNISIDGTELKIECFSTESGKLVVNGKIDGAYYFGKTSKKRSLFSSKSDRR